MNGRAVPEFNGREVQRGLDRELESLFNPSGQKPRINAGLAELKEARAVVRAGSLRSMEWVEHDTALRRTAEPLDPVEGRFEATRAIAEIDRLDAEHARLNQELGHRRNEPARMDGERRAVEANERVEYLTSLRGLRVDHDGHHQPALQAIRPGGTEAVGVRGLSLGTADHLDRALRRAGLETVLESHGSFP